MVDATSPFFAPGQLYVSLLRTRNSQDFLLIQKKDDMPEVVTVAYPITVVFRNLILPQEVELCKFSVQEHIL